MEPAQFDERFEELFLKKIFELSQGEDPAHDLSHFKRVVKTAKYLCTEEGGNAAVVVPAAWLHDFVNIAKDDPRRSQASRLSAEAAVKFLAEIGYPERWFADIARAIESHSFSAAIQARTLEAKIVQDADRIDGLGAIGIARCFATAGLMKRAFYSETDPFCESRQADDSIFTIDHFFKKLFKTAETLQTSTARAEGLRRVATMRQFLVDLRAEI
jgi:uncharacterized protein